MDTARFKLCRSIFEDVVELPSSQRADVLRERCGDDVELRAEIEKMLESDSAAGAASFLGTSDARRVASSATDLTGLRIGKYRVLRAIASGGMGTVYEAEQDHPRRRVAIKVLHAMFASKNVLRRFQVESEVLAQLRHPGIAQVFEAGVHAIEGEGYRLEVPWYALELLEGATSITCFARDRKLSLTARLELFVRVSDAVHHAHTRGIVHRDLKPPNILVDQNGEVKVIDFGVARARGVGGDVPSMLTATGELVGTLRYMAPEQFSGDPDAIDTRTDVYALGLVLYELVCETYPFDVEGLDITEVGRIVRESSPIAPRRAAPGLPEEVEWIVLRALEKEPARRYASAAEFSEDLSRYSRREPLIAGPPSKAYRLRKFVLRNRIAVSAAAAVLLSLVVGLIASLVSLDRAKVAESEANASAHIARDAQSLASEEAKAARAAQKTAEENEAVSTFVVELFQRALDQAKIGEVGRDLKVVDVLADMSERLDATAADNPRVAATAHHHLASLYHSLSEFESAEHHFRARIVALEQDDASRVDDIAQTRLNLAQIRLLRGDAAGALEELERAHVSIEESTTTPSAKLDELKPAVLHRRGRVLHAMGRLPEAEVSLRAAVETRATTNGRDDEGTLDSMNALSVILMDLGRLDEAEELCEEVIERLTAKHGADHPYTMMASQNLATLYHDRKEYARALDLMVPQLAIRERVAGPEHRDTLLHRLSIAAVLAGAKRPEDAIEMVEPALEPMLRGFGADNPDYLRMVGFYAHQLVDCDRFDDAVRTARTAFEAVVDDGRTASRTAYLLKLDALVGYAVVLRDGSSAGLDRMDAAIAKFELTGKNAQLLKMLKDWRAIAATRVKSDGS